MLSPSGRIVCAGCLLVVSSSLIAGGVPSRLFQPEGHGRRTSYYFPDDDVRRITALHDVVTPHISWATPIRGGTVQLLAIAHKSFGRWPVELAQRFDVCVTTVYVHDPSQLGSRASLGMFGQGPADVQARLLQAMNGPVEVVISDIPLETLGEAVRARLASLMARGVGYVGPTKGLDLPGRTAATRAQRDMVASVVPIAGLRLLAKSFGSADKAAGKILKLWDDTGAGRIADLSAYPRDGERPEPNRLQYLDLISMEQEAWCALAGRAVLWAAGRLPAGSALKIDWPGKPIARGAMPYALRIPEFDEKTFRVRVWDADGRLRHHGVQPSVPRLPAGRFFVGVELKGDGQVADWAFGTIEVRSPVEIAAIKLDDNHKRPGERVRATVTLSAQPPSGSKLIIDVLDNYGRCVSTSTHPAAQTLTAERGFDESLHLYNYVNVRLAGPEGSVVSEDRRAFYIAQPGPPRDDLSWMVWEAGAGFQPRSRILLKQFARLGMTGALTGNEGAEAAAMVNAHSVVYAYRMTGVEVSEQGVANPCFTNPGYRSSMLRQIQDAARRHRYISPLFYYLGDDVQYLTHGQDGCWSPSCRALLAGWVKRRYGTVEAVNAAWGTSYTDFAQVEPIKRATVTAALAECKLTSLCHWVDHQCCSDSMVVHWWREMGRTIRQVAPDTPSNIGSMVVGWSWPGSGFDFWGLADGKDLVFQYPNPWVHDIFRCAARRDALHGTWYGGYGLYNYRPYYDSDYLPWWSVFRGVNIHGQYYGGQSSTWYSERLLAADLGPMPAVAKILDNFAELRRGIAKLLFNADRSNDGVAIVYSPPSIHASVMFEQGLPKADEWAGQASASDLFVYMQCWEALSYLVRDMGLSFDVVPASELEDGRFLERKFRVLVLPLHVRVTAGEAKTIRQFVRSGGVLIADALPGMLDERCRVDHPGVLADVLGAKLSGGIAVEKIAMRDVSSNKEQPLGRFAVDGGVTLAGAAAKATAADGSPALLVHRYGQGHALMLNALAREYQILRTLGTEMPLRDTVAGLLADLAGIKPPVGCDVVVGRDRPPHRIQATEFHRYALGGAAYVGVLRHPKLRPDDATYMADLRPKPAWITFDRKAHVYDVRRGMYRGLTQKIEDVIYAARAELYALLPYEVRDLRLDARAAEGAIVVSAHIVTGESAARPTTHVFHVEVTAPDGRPRTELTRNVVAKGGTLTARLFIGYNAQPGRWQVTVRDVASGTPRQVTVSAQ